MRSLKHLALCLAVVFVALAASSVPAYADIIDGGFETADLSLNSNSLCPGTQTTDGWTATVAGSGSGLATCYTITDGSASEGAKYVILGTQATTGSGIRSFTATLTSQAIAATAGDILSFDFRGNQQDLWIDNNNEGSFAVDVDPLVNGEGGARTDLESGSEWTEFSYIVPTTGSLSIVFRAHSFAKGDGWATASLDIDNIRLTPVPEPSTFVLLGIGAITLFAWRRRRQAA